MTTPDPAQFYIDAAVPHANEAGASSYFSAPSDTLDPNLFTSDERVQDGVRNHILDKLFTWSETNGLHGVHRWATAYLAGSGITYQWDADRGNGDLDVLITMRLAPFLEDNPGFNYDPERLAADINSSMKAGLWPLTANTQFGARTYEVTYFVMPPTELIDNAYAAYDLTHNSWEVRPPELQGDPKGLYPQEWYDAAARDEHAAASLSEHHRAVTEALVHTTTGSSGWVNLVSQVKSLAGQATALFNDIHLGRQKAFSDTGKGYGDYSNFRWQRGKESGSIAILKALRDAQKAEITATQTQLYGKPLEGASVLLSRAQQQYSSGSYST